MTDDHSPDTDTDRSYSPPLVVDLDAGGDQEFAVNPAITVSPV